MRTTGDMGCLEPSEQQGSRLLRQALEGVVRTLPLRERSLLRLLYLRGASQRELAGALGISRAALRRLLRRAVERATDPMQLALVRSWRRLAPQERRLAYLHRVLGLSLREIARRGLADGSDAGTARDRSSASTLRRRMRQIERTVQRAEARRRSREERDRQASSSSG